jgi:MYND finger
LGVQIFEKVSQRETIAIMLSDKPKCPPCEAKGNTASTLLRCQGCHIAHYCGRDHQAADRESHKLVCNAVKKAQQKLDLEETKLRNLPPDTFTPARLFEEHAGHFWGILGTRNYMRARYVLIEALLKAKTYAAVKAAHDHAMDCLRLCRSDNMGVRDMLPALKLRLGRDQECYDFIKWYATTGQKGDYNWSDLNNPFLDLKGEDVFEKLPANTTHKYANLPHTVALTLHKLRLKLDLRVLQQSSIIGSKVPQEIMDNIRERVVGDLVSRRKDIMDAMDLAPLNKDLDTQIQALIKGVETQNPQFWDGLFQPKKHLAARIEAYSPGSVQEMQRALHFSFDSWTETPGAMDLMRELLRRKV